MSLTSRRRILLAAVLPLLAAPALAQSPAIAVGEAWTRPTAAGLNAAGYLIITNTGPRPDRLVSAASAVAAKVSLHESREVNGVMTMRELQGLPIHGGATLILAPGGYHLMLEDLKRTLALGDRIAVDLSFFKAGTVRVELVVRATPPEGAMPGMKM